jgi:hypothetical protein
VTFQHSFHFQLIYFFFAMPEAKASPKVDAKASPKPAAKASPKADAKASPKK